MVAVVARLEARFAGDVHEAAVAVVPEEDAGRPVLGVVVGHGRARLALARAVVEGIDAEVEVEEAVAVVVGHRHGHGRAAERLLEAERAGDVREAARAVVREQHRPRAQAQDQVLVAVVVHVGEERLRGVVEDVQARALRHVLEGAVAPVPVEPVRQARGLGDVDVVEAVAVGIPDRDAVVAVRVAGEARVDGGDPGVEAHGELAAEGRRFPPKAALVTSAKTGAAARLRWCSDAVHSRTRQAPSGSRRQRRLQRPTHSARLASGPRPTMS